MATRQELADYCSPEAIKDVYHLQGKNLLLVVTHVDSITPEQKAAALAMATVQELAVYCSPEVIKESYFIQTVQKGLDILRDAEWKDTPGTGIKKHLDSSPKAITTSDRDVLKMYREGRLSDFINAFIELLKPETDGITLDEHKGKITIAGDCIVQWLKERGVGPDSVTEKWVIS